MGGKPKPSDKVVAFRYGVGFRISAPGNRAVIAARRFLGARRAASHGRSWVESGSAALRACQTVTFPPIVSSISLLRCVRSSALDRMCDSAIGRVANHDRHGVGRDVDRWARGQIQ